VIEPRRPDSYSEIKEKDISQVLAIIARAQKFLIGKTMSAEDGQERVLRFFRFCMLNQFLLNTTRNLDAARSAFVEDEKSNG